MNRQTCATHLCETGRYSSLTIARTNLRAKPCRWSLYDHPPRRAHEAAGPHRPRAQAVRNPVIIGNATLYLGDCREILPTLPKVDAVVTDPPWGSNTACNSQRFTRNESPWWANVDSSKVTAKADIKDDDVEFDPRPFAIGLEHIFWGANWFTRYLPHSGGWLIWDKRLGAEDMAAKGWPLGEAELAWTDIRGSTRVFRNLWSGLLRSTEKGEYHHPTQKPIALMHWCLQQTKTTGIVLDPFMGAGSCGVACMNLGRKFIGIEIEPKYFDIACERIDMAQRQQRLCP